MIKSNLFDYETIYFDTSSHYKSKESLSVCVSVCLSVCASDISADQDQTDLRVSTWLLLGSRVCHVRFVWTAMIPLIHFFINTLQILRALSTGATSCVRTRANHCRAHFHDIP